ncbi:HEAT repeat domain-containing protein [Nocardia sp. CA-129566]|uniref:HEAT repeat domain-containing protein n=1 Tax=Nocardia sp. CA-129566 TaxID=3239976 RepID=UPI003D99386C
MRGNLIKTLTDRWPDDPETRSLLHDLVHVDGSAHNRTGVVRLLASRWPDERTCETLRQVTITDPERSVAQSAGLCLDKIRPGEAMSWMLEYLRSPVPEVRARALMALRSVWEDHPDTRTALHAAITADDCPGVRAVALRELGDRAMKDPVSRALVHDCLARDSSPEVRCAALDILDPSDDPDAVDLVRRFVIDPDPGVRVAAIEVLQKWRPRDRAATTRALYERITIDEDPEVCAAAFRALLRNRAGSPVWPNHTAAITWLREYIAADPFAESRRYALFLADDVADDPDIRALMGRIAEHHPDDEMRSSLITRLTLGEHSDAGTQEVIRRLAATDSSWHVRACAVQGLGKFSDDLDDIEPLPDASLLRDIELLCERAVADPEGNVRGAAWEMLTLHAYLDDVSALRLRRAVDDPDTEVRKQLLVEIVDDAKYADDRTPTATYLTERADHDPDPDVSQLAADLLTDLISGKDIERPVVGTRYRWY